MCELLQKKLLIFDYHEDFLYAWGLLSKKQERFILIKASTLLRKRKPMSIQEPVTVTSSDHYPTSLRWLHWTIAFLIIGTLIAGFLMANVLPDSIRFEIYGIHKSFGMIIWILACVRIAFRLTEDKVPPHPDTVKWYEHIGARLVYFAFYVLMIAFPLSGYLMSSMSGRPVDIFGLPIPSIFPENKEIAGIAHELHEIFGYVLAAFITLHLLGTLKHYIWDKENLLKRMWKS